MAGVAPASTAPVSDAGIPLGQAPLPVLRHRLSVLVGTRTAASSPPRATERQSTAVSTASRGYFLSKILYGQDRLTTPLLRKKRRQIRQGEATSRPSRGTEAFDVMAEVEGGAEGQGPNLGRDVRLRVSGRSGRAMRPPSSLKACTLNNLDPNARHCMASAVVGFMRNRHRRTDGLLRRRPRARRRYVTMGLQHGGMHPILWSRLTSTRLTKPGRGSARALHLRASLFRARRQRHRLRAADGSGDPQLSPTTSSQTGAVNRGLRREERVNFTETATVSATASGPHPAQKAAARPDDGTMTPITFGNTPGGEALHARIHRQALRRSGREAGASRQDRRPEEVMSLWTMGFNQHSRGGWVNSLMYNVHLLVSRSRARQLAVLADRPALDLRHRARVGTFAIACRRQSGRHQSSIARPPSGSGLHRRAPSEKPGAHAVLQNRIAQNSSSTPTGPVQQQHAGGPGHERGLARLSQPSQLHHRVRLST